MDSGCQQNERLSVALRPGWLLPDEASLAQRLRLLLEWARSIRFVNVHGVPAGTWGDLLERDPSFVLAELVALPVAAMRADVTGFEQLTAATVQRRCSTLARRLEGWMRQVRSWGDPADRSAWAAALSAGFAGLEARFALLLASPEWALLAPPGPSGGAPVAALAAGDADAARALRRLWLSQCGLAAALQLAARRLFDDSLATGLHDPAIGLLLAWMQTLHRAREPLNQFGPRLLQDYYGTRLALPKGLAGTDTVHLVLELQSRFDGLSQVRAGGRFIAQLPGGTRSVAARRDHPVQALRVEHLLGQRQLHDPLISPERDYGCASRLLACRHPLIPIAAAAQIPDRPIFDAPAHAVEPTQGLAIASPLLALSAADRTLRIGVWFEAPADAGPFGPATQPNWQVLGERLARLESFEGDSPAGETEDGEPTAPVSRDLQWARWAEDLLSACPNLCHAPWLAYLWVRCRMAASLAELRLRLGRLLAVWLCGSSAELDAAALQLLREQALEVTAATATRDRAGDLSDGAPAAPAAASARREIDLDDPLSLIEGNLPLQRDLLFERIFRGAWKARLSTPSGWLTVSEVVPWRVERLDRPDAPVGLQMHLRLGADDPALVAATPAVHGAGWPALPVVQLLLDDRSRLFPFSLLQRLRLHGVALAVEVAGLRDVRLGNQLGRIDASKPFTPLGPLPQPGDWLVFSHPELSAKPLQQLSVDLHWARLPAGGFGLHYAGYPDERPRGDAIRVRTGVLTGGGWSEEGEGDLALFELDAASVEQPDRRLCFDPQALLRHRPSPEPPGDFDLTKRQGHFRLRLDRPAQAFGHAQHPLLLTEVLTRNARTKKPQPLPNPPYTPLLDAFRLNYSSSATIPARSTAATGCGVLLHVTPFGRHPVSAWPADAAVHLLPPWPGDAQLAIGLVGACAEGSLSLMVRLRAESAQESLGRPQPTLRWEAWCGNRWRALEPHRTLLDETEGFLRSGIVLLELPPGMTADCPSLPAGCHWLRLVGDGALDLLAGLQGVWTNGVTAELVGPALEAPLPALSVRSALDTVPGLGAVHQPWPSRGSTPDETDAAWITRASERIRHRGRVGTAWDCERIVLQEFPEVFKVRCVPAALACHGVTTVVVVPALPAGREVEGDEQPRLDAATLAQIRRHLRERMPPGTDLVVRNAVYERVQVRCSLVLRPGEPVGARARAISASLRRWLSPWCDGGLTARFDWSLAEDEVAAYLRTLPGVERVEHVALLKLVPLDDGRWGLVDTGPGQGADVPRIQPKHPYSLLLPTRGHPIEVGLERPRAQRRLGVSDLALGSSFVIGA